MKPGEKVVLKDNILIYGVMPYAATCRMKHNKRFARKFSNIVYSPFKLTIQSKLKGINKLLRKNKVGQVRMLTDDEIQDIKETGKAPIGSLLCATEKIQ